MVNSIMEKISQNSYDVQRKNLNTRLLQSVEFRCPGLNSRHSQSNRLKKKVTIKHGIKFSLKPPHLK